MNHDFERVFRRLRRARMDYEKLRIDDGSLEDRAEALARLHSLRAEMSVLRHLL